MGDNKKAPPVATAGTKKAPGATKPPPPKQQRVAPKGPGAPTKFDDRLALRIYELAQSGQTDAEIARAVGISVSTLTNWKVGTEGFLAALKDAKGFADELVKLSLFRRAVGYSAPAAKFFMVKKTDAKGATTEKVVVQPYTEHYPPDTTACIFFLKNRCKDEFRDRQELTGKDGAPMQAKLEVVVTNLTKKPEQPK